MWMVSIREYIELERILEHPLLSFSTIQLLI